MSILHATIKSRDDAYISATGAEHNVNNGKHIPDVIRFSCT